MQVQIFRGRDLDALQSKLNKWFKEHMVSPETARFKVTSVYLVDDVEHIIEHTVFVFYVPMHPIG